MNNNNNNTNNNHYTLALGGLAMGIALIMYGLEEEADGAIEQLLRDKVLIIISFHHYYY